MNTTSTTTAPATILEDEVPDEPFPFSAMLVVEFVCPVIAAEPLVNETLEAGCFGADAGIEFDDIGGVLETKR
ncbi:conserved hypothetical protein [Ricinus communis]|uniref:Uncharacterized protein n=1 Tax=Ricinus communis TaxID=3988 RepID=B9S590_RICCO|nr:conserved hypothetical protein [Ricinus communis]